MKSRQILVSAAVALGVSLIVPAYAQEPAQGKTRAQVNAELAEATRTGDITAPFVGGKLNELYPDRYPKATVVHDIAADQPTGSRQDARQESASAPVVKPVIAN